MCRVPLLVAVVKHWTRWSLRQACASVKFCQADHYSRPCHCSLKAYPYLLLIISGDEPFSR